MKSVLLIQCLLIIITLILTTKVSSHDKVSHNYNFGHSNFDEQHEHKQKTPQKFSFIYDTKNVNDYLLGNNTLPLSYDVYIKPYLFNPSEKMFSYDGEVIIKIIVTTITNDVRFHYHWDLDIDTSKINLINVRI